MSSSITSASAASEPSRDRGEQILSAKKKLKSYRAKQALMAQSQKRSSTSSSHSRSGSIVRSAEPNPVTAVAEALSNEIVSRASTSTASALASAANRPASHGRSGSRSGHGRGHSRAGSISITPAALWSQAQAISSSAAPVTAPLLGRPASIIAPSTGHGRTHSRTHSRNFSRSRPVSISMLGAKKEEPVVVAIEHRAESAGFDASTALEPSTSLRRSQQFLDSSALFGGVTSASSLRASSNSSPQRFSNVTPVSPALFDQSASQGVAVAALPSPSAPSARHSRRLSRHARTPSVATKRESMEIMGGLAAGLGLDVTNTTSPLHSVGSSRRRSSRMSNLPSASLLFGSSDPGSAAKASNNRVSVQQWDWRRAIADAAEEAEEGAEGRLTALDKLEGRTATARATQAERPSSVVAASRASRRLSSHTRTESIQIPNLEEIHQNEINERRASWNLQAIDGSTSTPASAPAAAYTSNRRESWGRSLGPLPPSSLLSTSFSSPALPNAYLSSPGRPESMVLRPESPQPEGLDTLVEEEEEDEASPSRERPSLDMPVDGRTSAEQERRKQRREMEDETVKRNRRASLAPKPLKLKSRPPSLYLTPSQRNGLVSSPSLPNFVTSPLIAAPSADEATPKGAMAVLPETASDEESQVLEQVEEQDTSATLPSRSTTCPDLSTIAALPEVDEQNDAENDAEPPSAATARSELAPTETKEATSPVATDFAADDVVSQEQRQLEELQKQILRAHRNSVVAPVPPPASAEPTSAFSSGTPSRQGMRTLRLGSQANLASIMESGSSAGNPNATTTPPAQRRRSLIMGSLSAAPMSGSSSRDNDLAASFGSSVASSRAARRSSIIYKPSTASVPETASSHAASDSIASFGGVPLAVHDELKAKANRDAALLESTKKQVEVLERELATETERSAREKAELEQWNLDKEEHLFDRAQRAETAARQAEDSVVAMRAELEQVKEQLEDLQAEREVLQDDIEGWRSRCQDLEKTLRSEKVKSDDHRKLRAAASLRIKQLTKALEQNHSDVPADDLGVLAALELPQLDLATVLRSPNLGAISPNLEAAPGLSPSLGPEEAPPQITKLLADMRQQIFNLAGSLEHERKQHLHAKEEVARLQQREAQQVAGIEASAEKPPVAAAEQSFSSVDESRDGGMSASDSFNSSVRRSSGMLGKNKRHVFAYDSSMGSFGQSHSSASLSMAATDDTAHTDIESDMSDSFLPKLPSSDSELIGLGMGNLQTLDEIEEVSELSESVEGSNVTLGVAQDHKDSAAVDEPASPAWVDIEAGAADLEVCRPSLDASESSFGATYQDAENAPPTPDLCRSTEPHASPAGRFPEPAVADGQSAEHSTQASSSSSSGDSHVAPSTPPMHTSLGPADAADAHVRTPSPRPEFHREWSFEWGATRSRKMPSTQESVEDFFGILCETRLPPLSTSEEPLDLPPIIVAGNGTILPTARINKDGKPVYVPSASSGATRATASLFGGRRPPVARSAYLRESFDATATPSVLEHGGGYDQVGHAAHGSSASSLAALGSRALSRMSLQGLTGAFSGLSGYLTNQSGAAVTAAAAATKMCNADPPQTAMGWATTQQRRNWDDEDEEAAVGVRNTRPPPQQQLSWSSSTTTAARQGQLTRRYVRKSAVPIPNPTPVWQLDFSSATASTMTHPAGPVFVL